MTSRSRPQGGFSAARLAAEALFAPAPSEVEPTPSPTPVAAPLQTSGVPPSIGAPEDAIAGLRTPRVHRVGRQDASTEAPNEEAAPERPDAPAGLATRRTRQRRSSKAIVTAPIDTTVEGGETQEIEALAFLDGGRDSFANPNWPRYPRLLARIDALQVEAARLRRREKSEAIDWIRRAIREHGLTDADLGLTRRR